MNVSCMNAFPSLRACATLLLPPLWCMSSCPLCVCVCVCPTPSHPSRAVHLYLSETSVEIDSSDGMISEASTKDPSSSEEEGPSSDEDDGDDSDWGGGDRQKDRNTDMKASQEACWKDAQMAPVDYVPRFCRVGTRWNERCCCVENKHIVQEWEENGKKVLFESFWIRTKRLERCFWWSLWNKIKCNLSLVQKCSYEGRNLIDTAGFMKWEELSFWSWLCCCPEGKKESIHV